MADVTLDNIVDWSQTNGASHSFYKTSTAGSMVYIFVISLISRGTPTVTYGGYATRLAGYIDEGGDGYGLYVFVLANSPGGSQEVVLSASSTGWIGGCAASYTNVDQNNPIHKILAKSQSSGSSITDSITTTIDSCMILGFTGSQADVSAGTGATQLTSSSSPGNTRGVFSGGLKSPAGAHSMTVNLSVSSTAGMILFAIPPADSAGTGAAGTDLVSWYDMESDGSDEIGNNDATPTNITFGSSYGKVDNGGVFNAGDHSELSDTTATGLNIGTGDLSMACWFNRQGAGVANTVQPPLIYLDDGTGYGAGGNAIFAQINTNGGQIDVWIYGGSSNYYVGSIVNANLASGWHHLVAIKSGGEMIVYIDGVLQTISASTTGTPGSQSFNLTRIYAGSWRLTTEEFNGYLDTIGIWDKALTADDVAQLYNGGSGVAYADISVSSVNDQVTSQYAIKTTPSADTVTAEYEVVGSISNLADDFNDNSIDTGLWNNFGGTEVQETNQRLEITTTLAGSYEGIVTNDPYNLTGSAVSVHLIDEGNQALSSFEVYPVYLKLDDNNGYFFQITGGSLRACKNVSSSFSVIGSTTYSSAMKWLRIRESGGTTYFEYSENGNDWTTLVSESNAFSVKILYFQIMAGTWDTEASTTTAIFDDVNIIRVDSIDSEYAIQATITADEVTAEYAIRTSALDQVTSEYQISASITPDEVTAEYLIQSSHLDGSQQEEVLVDENTTATNEIVLSSTYRKAQSFEVGDALGKKLSKAVFGLRANASLSGDIWAELYAHSGTYGGGGKPTGSVLAVSDTIDASALSGLNDDYEFTFSDENQIELTDQYYCIVFRGLASSNMFARRNTSSVHPGNYSYSSTGVSWTAVATYDLYCKVYALETGGVDSEYAIQSTPSAEEITSEYQIQASILDQITSQYAIHATISADEVTSAYEIQSTYATDAIDSEYAIQSSVSEGVSSEYAVQTTPSADEVTSEYSIQYPVSTDALSAEYAVQASSLEQIGSEYAIYSTVSPDEITSAYKIKTSSSSQVSAEYVVIPQAVLDQITAEYAIQSSVSDQVGSEYAVQAEYLTQKGSEYSIESSVIDSQVSLGYSIESSIVDQIDSEYKIKTIIGDQKGSEYAIKSSVDDQITSEYLIRTTTLTQLTSEYVIEAEGVIHKASQYRILSSVSPEEVTAEYRIITTITPTSVSSEYVIISSINNEVTSQYSIQSKHASEIDSEYRIKTIVDQSTDSEYAIMSSHGQQIGSEYIVVQPFRETVTAEYAIQHTVATKSVSMGYELRGKIYRRKTSPYSEKTSPFGRKNKPYTPFS